MKSNLNLFSLYNKIIGTDPLNINVLQLDHTTSKFINKMFAIKYPSYVIKNKRNFNVDDISEFTRLFTVLEEKYFDGTINYEIPVFGIHENIFFNDYPKDIDTNLSIKINNIKNSTSWFKNIINRKNTRCSKTTICIYRCGRKQYIWTPIKYYY